MILIIAQTSIGAQPKPVHPSANPSASPTIQAVVINIINVAPDHVAAILRGVFPSAKIGVDRLASAIIVMANPDQIQQIRALVQSLDVQNPTKQQADAVQLRFADPRAVVATLHPLFSHARIATGPNKTVVISASPQEMGQIKSVIASIDVTTVSPPPTTMPAEAVRISQARPQSVASAVSHEFHNVRAAVSGSTVVLSGPPDDVARAKALIASIDVPPPDMRFTQVYRLRFVDAQSVANLISKSFRDVQTTVDKDLNAISVSAIASQQQRIADAIVQVDVSPGASVQGAGTGPPVQVPGAATGVVSGNSTMQVITLKAAVPGVNQGASTTATDIATAVTQFLQPTAPDLHITVPANSNQLMVSGSPFSIKLAKQIIDQLDVAPPLVVLDTEILEVDENAAKNLGLTFHAASLSTIYTEIVPTPPPNSFAPPPLLGLQPVTRTPLTAQFDLNFLIQHGEARVLADPRITTISGRTASIRAGDTSYILTQTGGGVGTVASQQLQPFQTGVSLDITPVVNAGNSISVTLHPSVSSLAGTAFNLPQIATRDTQTTVTLLDNQTLVIGGLIQDTYSRTDTKTPILGDLPLVGRLFHGVNVTHNKNELIIVVTPHIVTPGSEPLAPGPALPALPTPAPLPTLPASMMLPTPSGQLPHVPTTLPTFAPMASGSPPATSQVDGAFTFGAVPSKTYAGPNDPVKIFYASFSPTQLKSGTLVQVSAITTTNVNRLTVGYGGYAAQLSPMSPGQWQAAFNFIPGDLPVGQSQISLTMTAYRQDGVSTNIPIPVTITP